MSDTAQSTIETISQFVAEALTPILPFVGANDASGESIKGLARTLGWELPSAPPSLVALRAPIVTLAENAAKVRQLFDRIRNGEEPSDSEVIAALAAVITALGQIINAITQLNGKLASELPAGFVNTTHIDQNFASRLIDSLLIQALRRKSPVAMQVLRVLGVFEVSIREADTTIFQSSFTLYRIHWDRITGLLKDPSNVFRDTYQWGTNKLDLAPLLEALQALSLALATPGVYDYPSEGLVRAVAPTVDPNTADIQRSFEFTLVDVGISKVDAIITAIPKASPGELQGLAIALVISGGQTKIEIPLTSTLTLVISGSLQGSTGIALALRPAQGLKVISDFDGTRSPVTGADFGLEVDYKAASSDKPFPLLSLPSGMGGLTVAAGHARGGFHVDGTSGPDFFFEAGVDDGKFILGGGQGDGFLNKLLPKDGIQSNFQIIIGFSFAHGVYFKGSASLEIQLPLHTNIGPIDIQSLYLVAGIKDGKIPLEVSANMAANLGPLKAVVERLGITATVDFPGSGGNLGPVNIGFGFKPPRGVGLSINAGPVSGGGYLFFDPDKGEYGGVLQLDLAKIVTVTAIGLITTRMPDGSKGFSLLIIITAEFATGIQLGFGFTLLGVGGLLGLNRTMNLQALADGVRNGALTNIMFPHDVIANAPRIISDLRNFFPPENGKFLIGPMVKLGWGTPTLVSLSLGIIIEIPGNVAIVGILRAALPTNDAALIVLQVSFIGALEFDKSRVWFFATLFESRVLFFTIEGDMGLLMAFGDDATFVLSVGGFHPQFNPPPLPFPSPRRISFSILSTPVQRIRVEGYFAVTSNTVQFGANAELVLGFDDFGLQGHIGFDALIQFSPFYFIVQISASVSLKAFGVGLFSVRLAFALSGPSGWRARGEGSISLLFFSISADFDISWGEKKDTTLPPIPVVPLLTAELNKPENWKAELPANSNLLVALRKLDLTTDLVLHPVGTLRVSQKAVPLDLNIDKVGAQKPNDAKRFSIEVLPNGLGKAGDATEQFAIAQYQNMDDASKLSRPAYQPLTSGVELSVAGQQLNSARAVRRVARYEQIIIDNNFKRFRKRFSIFAVSLFNHFMAGAAVSKSLLSAQSKQQYQPFAEKVTVGQESYTVAYQADNKAYTSSATFTSEAAAYDFMQQTIAADPNQAETLHVIPQFEVKS